MFSYLGHTHYGKALYYTDEMHLILKHPNLFYVACSFSFFPNSVHWWENQTFY